MKSSAIAVILFVGIGFAQSKPTAPSAIPPDRSGTGRFHLIAAKAPGRSTSGSIVAFDELFLYDSATGRVWRYEPSTDIGEKGDPDQTSVDPYFTEVTVESLHGSHMEDLKRSANIYNYLHQARVQGYCKDHPLGTYKSGSTNQTHEAGTDCASFLKDHPIE